MDADFVTYEFHMFREGDCIQEVWARTAYNMPRQPVIAWMSPGGPSHCASFIVEYLANVKNTTNKMTQGHYGILLDI
eukprot:UN29952